MNPETINQPRLPVENIFIYSNIPLLHHSAIISIHAQTTCLDDQMEYYYARVESNSHLPGQCDNFQGIFQIDNLILAK